MVFLTATITMPSIAFLSSLPLQFNSSLPISRHTQFYKNTSLDKRRPRSKSIVIAWLPLPSRRRHPNPTPPPLPQPAVRALMTQFVNHEVARRRAVRDDIQLQQQQKKTLVPWWKRQPFAWAARILVVVLIAVCIAPGIVSLVA